MPELVAQRAKEVAEHKDTTLRGKLARQRELEAARKADATAPRLL